MSTPICLATTYTKQAHGDYLPGQTVYTRENDPTRVLLEECRAKLETAMEDKAPEPEDGSDSKAVTCAFRSGVMAVTSIILAHSSPLFVLLPADLYNGIPRRILSVWFEDGDRQYDRSRSVQAAVDSMDGANVKDIFGVDGITLQSTLSSD